MTLRINYEEATIEIGLDESLVFGRGATLDIDHNPMLHRSVGRFVHRSDLWWVENLGSSIRLTVSAGGGGALVGPGDCVALTKGESIIDFRAGNARYQLRVTHEDPFQLTHREQSSEPATVSRDSVPLTDEQLIMILAIGEPRLRKPLGREPFGQNSELAESLGWSKSKFCRKLDWLCERLTRSGVTGLHQKGSRAADRREALVAHLMETGQVSFADLPLLEAYRKSVLAGDSAPEK